MNIFNTTFIMIRNLKMEEVEEIYTSSFKDLNRLTAMLNKEQHSICSFLANWRAKMIGLPLATLSLLLIAGCGGGGQSVEDSSIGTKATGDLPLVAQVLGAGQVASCGAASDCDADGVADGIDIDDDGDGLIEIRTPRQLDMVRYQLDGKGLRRSDDAALDRTGCGDGEFVRACFGYELVQDISLTDYIAGTYPISGWKPIASDVDTTNGVCDGDQFTAIFEGNGFEISGLSITRPTENCIGLFGQASGKIHRLGVVADRIMGGDYVGSLVGDGAYVNIAQSYAISNEVTGGRYVGSLVGYGWKSEIAQSYGVSNGVTGVHYVGGLVGEGWHAEIIQSYVVSGVVRGNYGVGGLVGYGMYPKIIQSYAVSGEVIGGEKVGELLGGDNTTTTIVESYAINGAVIGSTGHGSADSVKVSYWGGQTNGMNNDTSNNVQAQYSIALHSPTHFSDIYSTWRNGAIPEGNRVAGIDHDGTIWCDEDLSGAIEPDEKRNNNRVWDFSSDSDYPAIRCTVDSLADQRVRWHTNNTAHEPPPNVDTSPIDVPELTDTENNSSDNRIPEDLDSPSQGSDTGYSCDLGLDCDTDADGVTNKYEVAGCELLSDCDGDGRTDDIDIDADGDGLIEIRTAAELDAVRHVLDGSGYKASRYARVDRTGCGDGAGIRSCSGYELVHNISLTDYIAEVYPVSGWQPIAPSFGSDRYCVGGRFSGVFDGNGFEVSGLYINRPEQSCVGLFGQAKGTIRDLGVVADRVIGKHHTSILLGYGNNIELLRSYGVADQVRGIIATGGLVGFSEGSRIVDSFVVIGEVRGTWFTGGLVGETRDSDIVRSYGVIGIVRGADRVGGLVGQNRYTDIVQSFVVSSVVSGSGWVGGLVGRTEGDRVIAQSYVVSGMVFSRSGVGGLLGSVGEGDIIDSYAVIGGMREDSHLGGLVGYIEDVGVQASYWDSETSGMSTDNAGGSRSQASIGLRSPTGYTGIYSTWDDGIMLRGVRGIRRSDTIWCDEDSSGSIEVDERRNDNRVWDFGSSSDYPALRCTGDSLVSQRAWWHLNITIHKPQLNVAAFPIDISPWLDRDGDGVDNIVDNCALMANADQLDTDNDDVGDVCDRDKDGDGIADGDEVAGCELASDCDNDGYDDAVDAFPTDSSEWLDSDGDRVGDNADNCPLIPNSDQLDTDNNDVCDDDGDGISNGREVAGCELLSDCDGDGRTDDIDIDADGDGLIEIRTAAELDAVRHVLDGSGYKASRYARVDRTGCGDGAGIRSCSGYELVHNISLTDYIAETYPVSGWQPIAPSFGSDRYCVGGRFSGVFDGNGFEVSGLYINRPEQSCVGLFGQAKGTIRDLGVVADRVIGKHHTSILLGYGNNIELLRSYGVADQVRGIIATGGLVGFSEGSRIVDSFVVIGEVRGTWFTGGLVGETRDSDIVRSYGVIGIVRGADRVGGLVGQNRYTDIVQSFVVSSVVSGSGWVGGLVGRTEGDRVIAQSYVVSGMVFSRSGVGGLLGSVGEGDIIDSYAVIGGMREDRHLGGLVGYIEDVGVQASYWDSETSGMSTDNAAGSRSQASIGLRSPTGYTGIYSTWDDGIMLRGVRGIRRSDTIWCDEDSSGSIEVDERRNDNRVWDFGSSSDYPALRCTGDSLVSQRAWWHLNITIHKPQLNVAAFPIDISPWLDRDGDGVDNIVDNCALMANADQLDTDNDDVGDVCDRDKDGDGIADGDEEAGCELLSDCDNDGYADAVDAFPTDSSEWLDSDGDRVGDNADNCPLIPNSDQLDTDTNDMCDDDGDGISNGREVAGCELLSDCDGDGRTDDIDIDADGDGLIEIRTAAELDAVRHVLDGSGYKASRYARVDRTGCGDGAGIRSCSGYELVHNISLTDYIAEVYPVSGWQPIAPSFGSDRYCVGGRFSGVFDGNGFEVSGLYINRPEQSCVGLFGQAKGTIRDLGVVADRVIGKHHTSILLGYGNNIELLRSYGVADQVRGIIATGGLVGFSEGSRIVDSFVVIGEVRGTWFTGGLVGETRDSDIVRSYGVIGIVRGADRVGGLVGQNRYTDIVQSFVVSSVVSGSGWVGGLVGRTEGDRTIAQSYVVSGMVFSRSGVGGLLGSVGEGDIIDSYAVIGGMREDSHLGGLVGYIEDVGVQASYWDSETSGMSTDNAGGSRSQASIGLRSPTGYTGIYSTWDDGIMLRGVRGIRRSDTIWCDEDSSGSIEVDERRNDNRVWDFGSSSDYPALRCTGDSLASQRAWWHLNITIHKPQLNVDAFPIDISPWLDRDGDGVDNTVDNCVFMANPDQLNIDNDDVGDVCDRDNADTVH